MSFAETLTEKLTNRAKHEAGVIERSILDRAHAKLKSNPSIMQGAIDESLDECNLALTPKGNVPMVGNHLSPYISDPFPAIQTVIAAASGSKPKVDGIHAGLGLADYAALMFLDKHEDGVQSVGDVSGWSDQALAAKLQEVSTTPTDGVGAVDWSKVWQTVKPVVFQLLSRWLFSA